MRGIDWVDANAAVAVERAHAPDEIRRAPEDGAVYFLVCAGFFCAGHLRRVEHVRDVSDVMLDDCREIGGEG